MLRIQKFRWSAAIDDDPLVDFPMRFKTTPAGRVYLEQCVDSVLMWWVYEETNDARSTVSN
jgi:hypothetical protein